MVSDSLTITKASLQSALKRWAEAHRNGECISQAEADALSADEHAAQSVDALWDELKSNVNEVVV